MDCSLRPGLSARRAFSPAWAAGMLLWLAAAGSAFAATPADAPKARTAREIAPADVRPHVEYLASPRLAGRSGDGARAAAEYVRRHFEKCGLEPLFDGGYFQEIPAPRTEGDGPGVMGRNVGAWLPGSDPRRRDEFIIVSAHYDHLGTRNGNVYAGADDNASGVAMMLEVAKALAQPGARPSCSVAFVGFDLEERMLWGSRWFAAHPPWPLEQLRLFITADMIGRSLGRLDLPAVFVLGSEHAPRLKRTLDAVEPPEGLEVSRLGIDLIGTRSDYGPFRDREVPFLFFSTGQSAVYHTPDDVPETLDYEKLARVTQLVRDIVLRNAADAERPAWVAIPVPDIDEAQTLYRIATLLLDADSGTKLSDVQRLVVSHTRNRTKQIVDRGTITPDERSWLTKVAQVLLLTVF
ncbi:MAG: M20/M25/M40 family metallo-hydrolase [Planctomycetales bacterium]